MLNATELLGQILPRYRATEEAEELNWMNAQSYYGMKDYFMAGVILNHLLISSLLVIHAEEANFMAAMCDYKILSARELDQENTRNAIEGFNIFMTSFLKSKS